MTQPIKTKCQTPHEFLISIIYSLSYTSSLVNIAVTSGSFIELGYVFSSIDIPGVTQFPAPDLLLINKPKKIIIAVECKSDIISSENPAKNIAQKFSGDFEESIRTLLEDQEKTYKIENVIHTFDIYAPKYAEIIREASEISGKDIILWHTTAESQIISNKKGTEAYTLKKHPGKTHTDQELENLLNKGIIISEDQIICNPLIDINPPYHVIFLEIAQYLITNLIKYREQKVYLIDLVKKIKYDYQSPIRRDRLFQILQEVLKVFPELGELKARGNIVKFKKQPKLEAAIEKLEKIRKEIPANNNAAKKYIRNIIKTQTKKKA